MCQYNKQNSHIFFMNNNHIIKSPEKVFIVNKSREKQQFFIVLLGVLIFS